MNLQFTLKEIENMLDEIKKSIDEYSSAIDDLDRIINELSISWISKETKTYETFYSKYKDNYLKLISMRDMMNRLYTNLDNKKNMLETMAVELNNKFE